MRKVIALLAIISTPAFGQGYVGVQLGNSTIDADLSDATTHDDSDTSFKLFGGIPLNNLFAVEVGGIDFGSYNAYYSSYDVHEDVEATALYAAILLRPQISQSVHLLAKAGLSRWSGDYRASGSVISGYGSGDGVDPMYGVGIEYNPTASISVRAEWERYTDIFDGVSSSLWDIYGNSVSDDMDGLDIDVAGISVAYRF